MASMTTSMSAYPVTSTRMISGYFFATWFSGQTIIYLILRQRKDDENLLEREDEEDWEEELEEEPAAEAEPGEIEAPDEAGE